MRKLSFGVVVALLSWSPAASAKIFDLYAQIQGGGGYGEGLAGDFKDQDFFNGAAGGMYGAKLGGEILFIDAWVEHNQYFRPTGDRFLRGTWTQLMVGFDVDFELGEAPSKEEKTRLYGEVGLAVGYGVGTGQQVEPPLSNSQVSDKGPLAQLYLGLDYRMNKVMSVGFGIPITYAYLFKNDAPAANDESKWYHSVNAAGLVHLRFHLELN